MFASIDKKENYNVAVIYLCWWMKQKRFDMWNEKLYVLVNFRLFLVCNLFLYCATVSIKQFCCIRTKNYCIHALRSIWKEKITCITNDRGHNMQKNVYMINIYIKVGNTRTIEIAEIDCVIGAERAKFIFGAERPKLLFSGHFCKFLVT